MTHYYDLDKRNRKRDATGRKSIPFWKVQVPETHVVWKLDSRSLMLTHSVQGAGTVHCPTCRPDVTLSPVFHPLPFSRFYCISSGTSTSATRLPHFGQARNRKEEAMKRKSALFIIPESVQLQNLALRTSLENSHHHENCKLMSRPPHRGMLEGCRVQPVSVGFMQLIWFARTTGPARRRFRPGFSTCSCQPPHGLVLGRPLAGLM